MRVSGWMVKKPGEPMVLEEAGHFVQESGRRVAEAALAAFERG